MRTHGYSTPVVLDGNRIVDVECDVDRVAEAGEGLVNRVVDQLIHEMVES